MKSSKMVLLLAVTMMSAINATKNPHVLQVDQFITGNCVNEKKQSWAHMVALHCNNPEFELRFKPELFLKEAQAHYPDMPRTKALTHFVDFLVEKDSEEPLFSQDADGMTPFDILDTHECKTELCFYLKGFKEFVEESRREQKRFEEELDIT